MALLPSVLQVPCRRLLGARIGAGSRIGFGTILRARKIDIGASVRIGPFSYLSGDTVLIGDDSRVRPLSIIRAFAIQLGNDVHIAPTAIVAGRMNPECRICIGDHSRIFPFCWLEPGEGIVIGRHVGIGGHGLIFTHGAWPDYLKGGPVSYGPVVIEDDVWLPWRVFVMPNVTIGTRAIIGAGAVVTRSVPAGALAAGAPAKVIRDVAYEPLSDQERLLRATEIVRGFVAGSVKAGIVTAPVDSDAAGRTAKAIVLEGEGVLQPGDMVFAVNRYVTAEERSTWLDAGVSLVDYRAETAWLVSDDKRQIAFIEYLRNYGIRVSVRRCYRREARRPNTDPGSRA